MRLDEFQAALRDQRVDGWLFFDHHQRDPLAYRVLELKPVLMPTRRWFYLIPVEGEPRKLVHRIESTILDALPGIKIEYTGWSSMVDGLIRLLGGNRRLAMQYSPKGAIPYVSLVDAGTVELVRSLGAEVVSSADLIQLFEARLDQKKLESHLEASRRVDGIRREAFRLVSERLAAGTALSEREVQQFILARFSASGLKTDHGPIVAAGENSGNPHHVPDEHNSRQIRTGDVLLIDLWAKLDEPGSIYYDITWTAYCGKSAPDQVLKVFDVVKEARDRAIERVEKAFEKGEPLQGFEVDDAARSVIKQQGYGEHFLHRTGHSIGEEVHGAGANMDNLETHDERRVLPWTCFSIEPGIYLPEFGIRLEVNVITDERQARVTGEVQQELLYV